MKQTNDHSTAALLGLLNAAPKSALTGQRRWLAAIAAASLLLGGIVLFADGGDGATGSYVSEEVERGKLLVTASASGTLQPTKSVDVGSELSGTLASVRVQENDVVKKGQLLAELDTAKLRDTVVKSQAAVAAAEASVALAAATVAEAKASLARMRHVAELSGGQVPARTELETAEAVALRALANEASAKAAVVQARATLKTDETNLGKATIRSPVDGVVLARKVEPGQTVAAAMTTPVLFVLAENDDLVDRLVERASFQTMCSQGYAMEFLECQGARHAQGAGWSLPEQKAWLEDRLAGKPLEAAKTCVLTEPVRCSATQD